MKPKYKVSLNSNESSMARAIASLWNMKPSRTSRKISSDSDLNIHLQGSCTLVAAAKVFPHVSWNFEFKVDGDKGKSDGVTDAGIHIELKGCTYPHDPKWKFFPGKLLQSDMVLAATVNKNDIFNNIGFWGVLWAEDYLRISKERELFEFISNKPMMWIGSTDLTWKPNMLLRAD